MPIQAIVHSSIQSVSFIDTPIPEPEDNEVVIKVAVSGTNPKDWKLPLWYVLFHTYRTYGLRQCNVLIKSRKGMAYNSGDDIAGIIHSVGKNIFEFKPGDRVGAQHNGFTPNGSFAEYSVAPEWMTFHLPHNVTFEEAATLPLAAMTAALSLYVDMGLPPPWNPHPNNAPKIPLVIYGVSTACGAFAAKYARLSGLGPLIGIAGRASDYAKTLVDYVVDYRQSEDALVDEIGDILSKEGLGRKAPYVLDAISENGTIETTLRFIDLNGGTVSTLLPTTTFAKDKEKFRYPAGMKGINTADPLVFTVRRDFGYLWSRYMTRLVQDGRLTGHPYQVVPGGLKGVLTGLQNLKSGKASAIKYVYRIEETVEVDAVAVEEGPQVPDRY